MSRLLVLGSGGREHALIWSLAGEAAGHRLFCAPGNVGTAELATNLAVDLEDHEAVMALAREQGIDLTIVGPEGPLAAGIYLVDAHVPCGLSTCVGSTTFEVTGQPVGGVVELPEVAGTPLEVPGSSGTNAGPIASIVAAIAAGTVTLTGAAWYARRRWAR
ncbi:MAG: phosphoribosylamine--glycine ligase [Candidatus Marinimicrobia bacterium]|nr:phosphoribosylamine--glycine ligase [Candidatus Neomarinimicrobiota bacterium]